jgi:putative tricarboxylic transport membrane protein
VVRQGLEGRIHDDGTLFTPVVRSPLSSLPRDGGDVRGGSTLLFGLRLCRARIFVVNRINGINSEREMKRYVPVNMEGSAMHTITQRFLLSLALAVAIPNSSAAASFPEKSIEFTVPFAAGGGSDIMARTIAAMMEKEKILPQPLVVVNRPGASGVLGYMHVGQKTGDPYAITTATNSFVIQPLLGKMKLDYREYTLIAGLALDEFVLIVPANSPHRTVRDLIEAAKRAPKNVKVGGSSAPSIDSIITHLVEKATGVQFNFIAFKSGGEVMTNLLGSHIDVASANPGEGLTQIQAKKARVLAAASAKRLASLPDVPTLRESGIDVVATQWRGVAAPKGLPKEAEAVLVSAFKRLSDSKIWQENYLAENNLTPYYMAPEQFRHYLDTDTQQTRQILSEMGLIK